MKKDSFKLNHCSFPSEMFYSTNLTMSEFVVLVQRREGPSEGEDGAVGGEARRRKTR